jgi:hypothetical protein
MVASMKFRHYVFALWAVLNGPGVWNLLVYLYTGVLLVNSDHAGIMGAVLFASTIVGGVAIAIATGEDL